MIVLQKNTKHGTDIQNYNPLLSVIWILSQAINEQGNLWPISEGLLTNF